MLPTLSRRAGKLFWNDPFDVVNDFSRAKMQATEQELAEERDGVKHLLP